MTVGYTRGGRAAIKNWLLGIMCAVAVIGVTCGREAVPSAPPAQEPVPVLDGSAIAEDIATPSAPPAQEPVPVLDGSAFAEDIAVCAEGLSDVTTRAVCVTDGGIVVLTATEGGHTVAREDCLALELGAAAPRILAAAHAQSEAAAADDIVALFAAADRCAARG